jgi:peptidoglycan/xylan/chitin deacetylase (PgdA/CDA1 family)
MFASSLKRVRRRVQRLRCEQCCARQANPLADHPGTIVTTFYDVEGAWARAGMNRIEADTVARILEIERRCGIRSTYNVVGRFARSAPDLIAAIHGAGNEIASHSDDHSILTRLARGEIGANLRDAKGALESLGIEVIGHRSPQSDWDDRVLDALVELGFSWSAENGSEPYPYRIRSGAKALWRFAVAIDDWAYEAEGITPAAMLERWQLEVGKARGRRTHVAIGFHAWVEAGPGRLAALEDFFHWLAAEEHVTVLPFGDVLRLANAAAPPVLKAADG